MNQNLLTDTLYNPELTSDGVYTSSSTTYIPNGYSWPSLTTPAPTYIPSGAVTTTSGLSYNLPFSNLQQSASELILMPIMTKIRALSPQKLDAVSKLFKKSLKRYKIVDKANNIAREIGFYDDLLDLQDIIWKELAPKIGYKNYNVRDAIWDAMLAELIKNDLTQKEFITLTLPFGITEISEK